MKPFWMDLSIYILHWSKTNKQTINMIIIIIIIIITTIIIIIIILSLLYASAPTTLSGAILCATSFHFSLIWAVLLASANDVMFSSWMSFLIPSSHLFAGLPLCLSPRTIPLIVMYGKSFGVHSHNISIISQLLMGDSFNDVIFQTQCLPDDGVSDSV